METSTYSTYPVHVFPWLEVDRGYDALAADLKHRIREIEVPGLVAIEGFVGLRWDLFVNRLRTALEHRGVTARWLSTEVCFLPASQIDQMLAPTLTDDPVFGRLFRGHLEDLWHGERVDAVRCEVENRSQLTVVYGFGASRVASGGIVMYVDMPKDCGQKLAAEGEVYNVGANKPQSFGQMYKRLYFVDWPMLNRIKRDMLSHCDLFVDGANDDCPAFTSGEQFRRALVELAHQPFRVKPWFAPGPWGGQWMKERFGLSPDQPNYAWSFELIGPENGLLLGDGKHVIECSFDFVLWKETDAILGTRVAARYGSYFPIRFDYLDTMDGTNLSCQVHPRVDYIRDEFGEPFAQDETYYIVTCKPGSRVFLGLRDDANLAAFHADATAARDRGISFDVERHVNSFPSAKHDLFLIPSGTVHCSGADNLVLEISATPYIYTFKIYDYLRKDLSGNLRHVHLDHAFANIDPKRRASWVARELRQEPTLLRRGPGWDEYRIGDIDLLFFAIHRLEFEGEIDDTTDGKFLVLNLVEGEQCEIVTAGQEPVLLRYVETIVIPARVGTYTLRNTGHGLCKVVKAFVKG
jgi:mannose-6-phosphate isomerase class I